MRTIWKYPLSIMYEQEVLIPRGGRVLSVGMQMDELCIWVMCSDQALLTPRKVRICGTGHKADDVMNLDFVGTVIQGYPTHLVWHVFIEPEEKVML